MPVAKRRRIDFDEDVDDQRGQNGFHGSGSSGMLSGYVKQKQQEGQEFPSAMSQSQTTVDLTGGTCRPCFPMFSLFLLSLEFKSDVLLTVARR